MNNNNNNSIVYFDKYKITYKIIENNCFYLEFIENDKLGSRVNHYSKIFTQNDIDKLDSGVFTNAESFNSTIKRVFNTENCGSFELKKIKQDKDNQNLIISLRIIVLEINIQLPRKSIYQNLDERILFLENQNLELKQRLLILEKFISNQFNNFNNNNSGNNIIKSPNINNGSSSGLSLSPPPPTSPYLSLSSSSSSSTLLSSPSPYSP